MNLFTILTYTRWTIKLLEQLAQILLSNVINGKPCLLFLVWIFGPKSQRVSQPLTWSSHIIFLFWRCYFPIVHTINLIRDVQDGVLLAILDILSFPNIAPSTTFHVHRCKILLPEHLLIWATMINSYWWCHNF